MIIEIGLRINGEDFGWRKFFSIHQMEEGVEELVELAAEKENESIQYQESNTIKKYTDEEVKVANEAVVNKLIDVFS